MLHIRCATVINSFADELANAIQETSLPLLHSPVAGSNTPMRSPCLVCTAFASTLTRPCTFRCQKQKPADVLQHVFYLGKSVLFWPVVRCKIWKWWLSMSERTLFQKPYYSGTVHTILVGLLNRGRLSFECQQDLLDGLSLNSLFWVMFGLLAEGWEPLVGRGPSRMCSTVPQHVWSCCMVLVAQFALITGVHKRAYVFELNWSQ